MCVKRGVKKDWEKLRETLKISKLPFLRWKTDLSSLLKTKGRRFRAK